MRCVAWSLAVTGLAVAILAAAGLDAGDTSLRFLGAGAGAALALVGVVSGLVRDGASRLDRAGGLSVPSRYFQERRRSPRHEIHIPVRMAVNGKSFTATLSSINSSGALLRLHSDHARALECHVGEPVSIHDYPAGHIARVGARGVYVDFAVAFAHASSSPGLEPAGNAAS